MDFAWPRGDPWSPVPMGALTGQCRSDPRRAPDMSSGVNFGTVPAYYGLWRLLIAGLSCVGFGGFSTSELGLTRMVDFGCIFLSRRLTWFGLPAQYVQ